MSVLVLIIIYVAFIAVGIPDSLTGTAWPAIYPEFNVPVSFLSIVTTIICGSVIVSSILSVNALQKLGTAKTTAVSAGLIAAGIFGFSVSPNYLVMCLFALLIGAGAGAINTGLNNYVTLNYHARHLNYLHCFYGVGLMCSTSLLALTIEKHGWRTGYRWVFFLMAAITAMLFLTIPVWNKEKKQQQELSDEQQEKMPFVQMIKTPSIRAMWVAIFMTNAIECAASTWLTTYLVDARNVSEKWGAIAATMYFAGLALGRFVSGLVSEKIKTWRRIFIGSVILIVAVLMLNIPLGSAVTIAAFCLVGFGNGSLYPNFLHLTPHNFEKKYSGSIMSTEIAIAYSGFMIAPIVFSFVIKWIGLGAFPVFMAIILVIMVAALLRAISLLKKQGRYDLQA